MLPENEVMFSIENGLQFLGGTDLDLRGGGGSYEGDLLLGGEFLPRCMLMPLTVANVSADDDS